MNERQHKCDHKIWDAERFVPHLLRLPPLCLTLHVPLTKVLFTCNHNDTQ